ncbi:energy-converting hydrogenase Eha subunit A [Nakamurella sp. UYEF19]|uniref:heliorhodopsin HeR n=1 Tax=Nakamurella sp. UYEF19 TaxID=1756392 RepID=UPI0033986A29
MSSKDTAAGVTSEALAGLRKWNIGLTVLHAVQGIAIIVLAGGFSIAVTSSYPTGPPGSTIAAPSTLFEVRIGVAVAIFLFLAAADHLLTCTVLRSTYEADLRRGINRFRWIEYSFSSTVMLVLIGFYFGLTGISTVVAVIGANVAMILFGWLQERMNPPGRASTTMMPFWFGTLAGAAPWIAILINLVGTSQVPGFVIGIFVSLLIAFFTFAVNQWLQYRGIGRWSNYAFGEKTYLVLSLVAKSLLAWQIFAGSLAS